MIELAITETAVTTETPKAKTKAQQVREYIAANPKAKPKQIAETVGVGLQYVYTVMWTLKKKARVKKAKKVKPYWEQLDLLSTDAPIGSVVGGLTLTSTGNDKVRWVNDDPVNHPAHYKVGGIETIDFIEAKKLNYRLGNVVKYLTRADHKGNKLEDLKKAQWYLEREIESLS